MLTTALLQLARRPTLLSVCEARDLASRLLDRPSRASARADDPDMVAGDYGRLRHRRCLAGSARRDFGASHTAAPVGPDSPVVSPPPEGTTTIVTVIVQSP
jgi:hypothetical protein